MASIKNDLEYYLVNPDLDTENNKFPEIYVAVSLYGSDEATGWNNHYLQHTY